MTDVKHCFTPEMMQTLDIADELPVVAIRIPSVGELSRKDRETAREKLWGGHANLHLFDDLKRLEKSFAGIEEKLRSAAKSSSVGLVVLVAGRKAAVPELSTPGVLKTPGAFRRHLGG